MEAADTDRNTGRVGPSALIAPVLMAGAVPKRVDDANTPVPPSERPATAQPSWLTPRTPALQVRSGTGCGSRGGASGMTRIDGEESVARQVAAMKMPDSDTALAVRSQTSLHWCPWVVSSGLSAAATDSTRHAAETTSR